MACFTAPLAEAVIVKAVEKSIEKKGGSEASDKVPLVTKVKWLSTMLFGGSALLAFEHIWHGEITAWFPFLTAMSNKEDTVTMLKEIGTVGVSMAVLITAVWLIMCKVADIVVKNKNTAAVKEATVS